MSVTIKIIKSIAKSWLDLKSDTYPTNNISRKYKKASLFSYILKIRILQQSSSIASGEIVQKLMLFSPLKLYFSLANSLLGFKIPPKNIFKKLKAAKKVIITPAVNKCFDTNLVLKITALYLHQDAKMLRISERSWKSAAYENGFTTKYYYNNTCVVIILRILKSRR